MRRNVTFHPDHIALRGKCGLSSKDDDAVIYVSYHEAQAFCDWYGPYENTTQTDPVGRADGLYKVTRGGSHSTPERFLRSANRSAMIPEDKHWLTGFRVVQATLPDTEPLPVLEPVRQPGIAQQKYNWPKPLTASFFGEPLVYVNLLAIWFTCDEESGREMVILESRLKAGSEEWSEPRGYLAGVQTPDGTIHIISSRNHYRFNLGWLMEFF